MANQKDDKQPEQWIELAFKNSLITSTNTKWIVSSEETQNVYENAMQGVPLNIKPPDPSASVIVGNTWWSGNIPAKPATPAKLPMLWVLADALPLVRKMQKEVKPFGYHLSLGGGVLNKGESSKDLDIYIMPLKASGLKEAELMGYLNESFDNLKLLFNTKYEEQSIPYAFKCKCFIEGKRIDIFIMGDYCSAKALMNAYESQCEMHTIDLSESQMITE